ncbi:site-specific DNA-methyltransferase [Aphanothece hegewaldii CCALA 016]|uniref:Site-specific DNA-methyltransferase n=1 Tax=Aphanothece hegewaldii CCALA 016 TaxID=2107694 RepID=A0A2T1LU92_9CHRO|nr:DUF3102 domain-containing protein [Aphanothece hegewaldii]PSF35026.1 site-specific DNA-methyltransferase [Aphanothece hegewaldii CCALA 016]
MNSSEKTVNLIISFDYFSLDDEQRLIIQQRTGEIRERLRRSAQDIWEIGQKLADVRSRLKHGQFDIWLKAEFGWSRRTAYNFISVYETFGERATLAQVDIATSALYLLAAPSTSQKVRDEFIEKAKVGESVTHKELREIIQKEKIQPSSRIEETAPEKKTEIVAIIPQSIEKLAIEDKIEPVYAIETPKTDQLQLGWYRLGQQHLLFYGDTASSRFAEKIPYASLAIAITNDDWDHDWLVERAKTVIIFPEADLSLRNIGQLLDMFSHPKDSVIFPWLPNAELLIVADQLQRKIYAGDPNIERCHQAAIQLGLPIEPLKL